MYNDNFVVYIDDLENEILFDSVDDMLDYLMEVDYEEYKRIAEEIFTSHDYDGKDYGTALCEAIEEQNNE